MESPFTAGPMPRWSQWAENATYSLPRRGSVPRTTPTTFSERRCCTSLWKLMSRVLPVGTGRKARVAACLRGAGVADPAADAEWRGERRIAREHALLLGPGANHGVPRIARLLRGVHDQHASGAT